MEFGEMKRNRSNWSNFCILLRRARLSASAGLSCLLLWTCFVWKYVCMYWSMSSSFTSRTRL